MTQIVEAEWQLTEGLTYIRRRGGQDEGPTQRTKGEHIQAAAEARGHEVMLI